MYVLYVCKNLLSPCNHLYHIDDHLYLCNVELMAKFDYLADCPS